jgi:hypothetical protein
MKFLKTLLNGSIITGMLYAGLIMKLEWATNLSLFMVWLLVCLGGLIIVMFLAFLIVDDSVFNKNGNAETYIDSRGFFAKFVGRSLVVCNIIMLVTNGYFVVGAFYTFNFITTMILYSCLETKAKRILGVSDAAKA